MNTALSWSLSSVSAVAQFDVPFAIGVILSLLALSCGYHFLLVRRNPGAPLLLKSWIPFFGVAVSFTRDPERLILQCKERYGDIFTLYIAGRKMNVVCDPDGISAVYRDDKNFPFAKMSYGFAQKLFGLTEKQGKDMELQQRHQDLFTPHLLAHEKVATLIKQFDSHLRTIWTREVQKLNLNGELDGQGVVVDLDLWIYRIMFESGGKMFFGETWPSDDDFFEDCKTFDDGAYSFFKYPPFMIPEPMKARERYFRRMARMFKDGLVNPSDLIGERMRHGRDDENHDGYGLCFTVTFWLVASLGVLPQDQLQEVRDHIRQYIIPENSTETTPVFNIDGLSQDPLLESALSETLRLHMNGLVPRNVQKDTTLKINDPPYRLCKDEWVFLSMAGVHKSPDIYEDPMSFRLKRFVEMHNKAQGDKYEAYKVYTKSGIRVRNPVVWWGGGQHICTGRRFAVKEVLLIVSTILHQFEISSVDGKSLQPPVPESTSRYGGGTEFPARHWTVRLRYRKW